MKATTLGINLFINIKKIYITHGWWQNSEKHPLGELAKSKRPTGHSHLRYKMSTKHKMQQLRRSVRMSEVKVKKLVKVNRA